MDPKIPQRYSSDDLSGKAADKALLLERFGLANGRDVPVLGIVSRLTAQKGFELLPDMLPRLLQQDVRLVVLGSGEERYESYFHWLRGSQPKKVGFWAGYDETLAHWIEAGADLFLMPSLYEPCGLNQMYSLRYGTIPVARRVGGLADTIEDGVTGFLFDDYTPADFMRAAMRAIAQYNEQPGWRAMMREAMGREFSWERSAARYQQVYNRVLAYTAAR